MPVSFLDEQIAAEFDMCIDAFTQSTRLAYPNVIIGKHCTLTSLCSTSMSYNSDENTLELRILNHVWGSSKGDRAAAYNTECMRITSEDMKVFSFRWLQARASADSVILEYAPTRETDTTSPYVYTALLEKGIMCIEVCTKCSAPVSLPEEDTYYENSVKVHFAPYKQASCMASVHAFIKKVSADDGIGECWLVRKDAKDWLLAFVGGRHTRLGKDSAVKLMADDPLRMIAQHFELLPDRMNSRSLLQLADERFEAWHVAAVRQRVARGSLR